MGIDEAVAIQGFMNRIQKATMVSPGNVLFWLSFAPVPVGKLNLPSAMTGGVVVGRRYGPEISLENVRSWRALLRGDFVTTIDFSAFLPTGHAGGRGFDPPGSNP